MWNRKRWNIFARELEDILAAHGFRLTQIDDYTSIHREKVRRLAQSLRSPKSFPVLNPEEIEEIVDVFDLSDRELLRLRAAVLTTSIEATLMGRIYQDDAFAVAEQILPMILNAMLRGNLSAVRGAEPPMYNDEYEDEFIDAALEGALELIDRATMALHLCRNVDMQIERIRFARQAVEDFTAARDELEEAEHEVRITEAWKVWHAEALKGLQAAQQYLKELGG